LGSKPFLVAWRSGLRAITEPLPVRQDFIYRQREVSPMTKATASNTTGNTGCRHTDKDGCQTNTGGEARYLPGV
jgi:hypothetical protein